MRERASEKLGLWICLPLLAWAVIWVAALSMPASDCDSYGADTGEEEVMLIWPSPGVFWSPLPLRPSLRRPGTESRSFRWSVSF